MLACGLVIFNFYIMLGRLYRSRLRENLSSSQTHFVMSSTSLECPPCKAKSNGVAPSSLGKVRAWAPPGRSLYSGVRHHGRVGGSLNGALSQAPSLGRCWQDPWQVGGAQQVCKGSGRDQGAKAEGPGLPAPSWQEAAWTTARAPGPARSSHPSPLRCEAPASLG